MRTNERDGRETFPTFASRAEAEAYSEKVGDAYFEVCYYLEGQLNLCLQCMHDLYAKAAPSKRPRMQTGVVRQTICPDGWPTDSRTVMSILVVCAQYRHEDTCHAYTVNEAMAALALEKANEGALHDSALDRRTFEPMTADDAANAREDLLRLFDWIESRLHYGIHRGWYNAPECFSGNKDISHLANIGVAQRYLAKFSQRDRKRWEGIHERAAIKHGDNLRAWLTVGKAQHDPQPRTWTHPEIDTRIIGLWPLVIRYNWTYTDLLKVLDELSPATAHGESQKYPLDCEASLKVHCRSICGLSKDKKGKTAEGMPEGWPIAEKLFARMEK